MMAAEIFEFDVAWAEKWTKTGVPFLSAPTVMCLCLNTQQGKAVCENYREISLIPSHLHV